MAGKRNKIRYQSTPKKRVEIVLTGNVYLMFRDQDKIDVAGKGDLLVFPNNEALNTNRLGEYEGTGFSGYFKVDVCSGKEWLPVLTQSIFPEHENYFSKKERPIDTFNLCAEILESMKEKILLRTYREHYVPEDAAGEDDEN